MVFTKIKKFLFKKYGIMWFNNKNKDGFPNNNNDVLKNQKIMMFSKNEIFQK